MTGPATTILMHCLLIWIYCADNEFKTIQYKSAMAKRRSDPVHC
jgi:hypothetical protein